MHSARVVDARNRLDEAGRAVRDEQRLTLDLPGTQVPAGRNLFLGEGMQVRLGGRPVFAEQGVDLTVRGPERIALTGPNGAGKTTLMRLITGELTPDSGEIRRNDGRVAYLSQRLDLLDLERTVAENFAAYAPERPEAERMNLLARFLFRGAGAHLPTGLLSGGERLRATLACVLCAEPAPQLLLLDEPTNNLDLVSVRQLESALNSYQGAFMVISHDERFLAEIGVDRRLRLADGTLTEAGAPGV
jgi:ATPase subunit of ABC transporter with duplicated ATPase domains